MLPDPSWNDTKRPYPAGQSLPGIVRQVAQARPAATALVHGPVTVSYGELDRAADGCAAGLATTGVKAGDLVPILLPRSTELVTALLGVLKLGAAYALIDPAWPDQRIRDVTGDLGARVAIAGNDDAGRAGLPGWLPGPASPSSFRPVTVPGSAPGCVFFTSGTTGRPKGVLTPHRALVRLFRPGTFARFAADSVVPLAAALPWDAFALELWSVLLNGGTSVIVDEPYLSAGVLRDGIATHRVDTAWLTSSLFNMIVDEDLTSFRGMRQVMIGGERLSEPHVRRFLAGHPRIALINGYGPVESTVFATTHRITRADCGRTTGIPIGRPVPDTQVHVLDGERPCPVNQPGELCLAGDGLALGYLNDQALTAEKFPHVLIGGKPVRVYRTGDIGWWDADGLLHYGGRLDRQVKIRGHRVEPAEVERQIETLPPIRRCAVIARPGRAGTAPGLAAFCVPAAAGDPLAGLRERLRDTLPSYQVPDTVLSVAALPLTSTGKLDERALLALADQADAGAGTGSAGADPGPAGRNETTGLVASVFAAVLGRADVPADVDFTALGGTSLDAGRVCARLSAELDRPLPVSKLLANPTAGAFGRWLDQTPGTSLAGPALTEPVPDGVPLSATQADFLATHLLEPGNRSCHCLGTWLIHGDLDAGALAAAMRDVHRRHEPLRAAYRAGREPTARVTDIEAPALVRLPAAGSATEAIESLRAELARPLDLGRGQVWRAALAPLTSSPACVFGYVVHHISFDGWSEAVLAADLGAAYNARRRGEGAVRPPPLSLAGAWTSRQEYLRPVDLDGQRNWLESELRGLPELAYPGGLAGPSSGSGGDADPGVVAQMIGPGEVARLDSVAAGAGVTRFAALLAGYGRVLAELTGQRDFGVGVPVAQRSDGRLSRAVGCHVNVVCVRLRGEALAADPRSSVTATGRIVARALLAQDVGLGEVVRLVKPPRSGRTPLFQNLFAYQDNAIPRLELGGARTHFVRQPYLALPAELQTDLWPQPDGGLRLVISFRRAAVSGRFAGDLAKRYADLIRSEVL